MSWTGTIVGTRQNPTPNDTMWITIEFTDGKTTFRKDFKIVAGGNLEALVSNETAKVQEFYATVPGATISVTAVPQSVTNFQARAMLRAAGLLGAVNAALEGKGGVELDAWEYSATVHRQSPLVLSLAASLGLTDQQIDAMFVQASQIAV